MPRLPEIDGTRAVAALAILVFHLDHRLLPQGWLAVDLFMLLSGFLITSIVLEHGHTERFLVNFYVRRGLRTWPTYYAALVVVFSLAMLLGQPVLGSLPYYLTFTQNVPYYWSDTVPSFPYHFIHTWSLAVEEQYYLFWPAALLLAGRRRVVPLSCAIIALCTAARAAGAHWTLLIARCDGFALGGILAAWEQSVVRSTDGRATLNRAYLSVAAVALPIALTLWSSAAGPAPPPVAKSVWMLAVNCTFFGLLGLTIRHAGHPALAPLRSTALGFLGRISYGVYLYHPVAYRVGDHARGVLGLGEGLVVGLIKVGLAVALAAVSWRFVERPLLRWKDRFAYRNGEAGNAGRARASAGPPAAVWSTSPA